MTPALAACVPLTAGLVYALSALYIKQATVEGGGLWRVNFLINWGQAVFMAPLLLLGHGPLDPIALWHILLTSLLFFAGQVSVFVALRFGDVSIVTPVMGLKVVMVAAMVTAFAHEKLPPIWWVAAAISTAATFLLGSGKRSANGSLLPALLGGAIAAAAFSGVDVCFQMWADRMGVWRFSACVCIAMGLWSLALLPFLEGPWWRLPKSAQRAFWPGLAATIGQIVLMAYCVVQLKGAAWSNLLYSSRGVWSIVLVWFAGPAFGNSERDAGADAMVRRLAGAVLMLAAIALVLK